MLEGRAFRVVFVCESHGVGGAIIETADKNIPYSGTAISLTP